MVDRSINDRSYSERLRGFCDGLIFVIPELLSQLKTNSYLGIDVELLTLLAPFEFSKHVYIGHVILDGGTITFGHVTRLHWTS